MAKCPKCGRAITAGISGPQWFFYGKGASCQAHIITNKTLWIPTAAHWVSTWYVVRDVSAPSRSLVAAVDKFYFLVVTQKYTNLVKLGGEIRKIPWLIAKFHDFWLFFHVPWLLHDNFPGFPVSVGTVSKEKLFSHSFLEIEQFVQIRWFWIIFLYGIGFVQAILNHPLWIPHRVHPPPPPYPIPSCIVRHTLTREVDPSGGLLTLIKAPFLVGAGQPAVE